ncbi:MAG TPA: exodeoxyribonuclease VII small subunit [Acidobacteriota bacterium]|nr:exodeoxyribonuclease VII small subunit [Acidobacteriota bacterium]
MTEKAQQFEDAFARLEEIVAKLEGGEVALEESLDLYAEGMKLVKLCGKKLTSAEQKIERLNAALAADAGDDDDVSSTSDEA